MARVYMSEANVYAHGDDGKVVYQLTSSEIYDYHKYINHTFEPKKHLVDGTMVDFEDANEAEALGYEDATVIQYFIEENLEEAAESEDLHIIHKTG